MLELRCGVILPPGWSDFAQITEKTAAFSPMPPQVIRGGFSVLLDCTADDVCELDFDGSEKWAAHIEGGHERGLCYLHLAQVAP